MNLPSITNVLGVTVSTALIYVLFRGLLVVVFDLSDWAVRKLEASETSAVSESSASSILKAFLFWTSVLFLGVMTWKLIERFALELAFFKAVAVAAGLCVLGLAALFVRFLMTRRRERTGEN